MQYYAVNQFLQNAPKLLYYNILYNFYFNLLHNCIKKSR